MGKIKITGGKPSEFEMTVNGEKVTQHIISAQWKQSCDKYLPVLTIVMYADEDVEIEGPCDIEILTRES